MSKTILHKKIKKRSQIFHIEKTNKKGHIIEIKRVEYCAYLRNPYPKMSEEHKQKLRDVHLGIHRTEAEKQKMRDNHSHLSGKDHPMYGTHPSDTTRQKLCDKHADFSGDKHPNYKGGPKKSRARAEEKRRDFGFIPLNDKFPGSDAHHLDKHFVLYIPSELHQSLRHNVITGKNMKEINDLAIRYTYGEHEESRWSI